MSFDELKHVLGGSKENLNVSKRLIKAFGLDTACLYSYLLDRSTEYYRRDKTNVFFPCSVEEIEKLFGFSSFKQRNILKMLEDKNLIITKFGQTKSRFICVNDDFSNLANILYKNSLQESASKIYTYLIDNYDNIASIAGIDDNKKQDIYNYLNVISEMNSNQLGIFNQYQEGLGYESKPDRLCYLK